MIESAVSMEREVFVLPNGESISVWEVRYGAFKRQEESAPCTIHEKDGTVRKGTVRYTVESADVSFNALEGLLRVGQQGQLSTKDDQFFEVTISSIEKAKDHVRAFGQASRKFSYKKDP